MRNQDPKKRDAVTQSALRLITRLGFDGVSIAKIAKDAGVSPATIYIYFESKEDMLNQLYIQAKKELAELVLSDLDQQQAPEQVIKDLLRRHWLGFSQHAEKFAFLEQFTNSPHITRFSSEEGSGYFKPMQDLIARLRDQGALKPLPTGILLTLAVAPLIRLSKQQAGQTLEPRELEQVIQILWESVKA